MRLNRKYKCNRKPFSSENLRLRLGLHKLAMQYSFNKNTYGGAERKGRQGGGTGYPDGVYIECGHTKKC